jgi:hypothetical protein
MFVTELGGGVYRFADASVVAYPLSSLDAVKQLQKQNLSPAQRNEVVEDKDATRDSFIKALKNVPVVRATKTDADGNFALEVPDNIPVFLFCRGVQYYRGTPILRMWLLPATDERMILSADNDWEQWRQPK